MADILMYGSIAVGLANIALAATLAALYGNVYRGTRAPFTIALLVFAVAFLLHNALVVYAYATMMPLVPESMNPYLLGIGLLEASGLAAMAWSATR